MAVSLARDFGLLLSPSPDTRESPIDVSTQHPDLTLTNDFSAVMNDLPNELPRANAGAGWFRRFELHDNGSFSTCYSHAMILSEMLRVLQPGVIGAAGMGINAKDFYGEANALSHQKGKLDQYADLITRRIILDGAIPTGTQLRFEQGKYPIALVFKDAADASLDERLGMVQPEHDHHFFRLSQASYTTGSLWSKIRGRGTDVDFLTWTYQLPNKVYPVACSGSDKRSAFQNPAASLFPTARSLNSHYFGGFFLVDPNVTLQKIRAVIAESNNNDLLRECGFFPPQNNL